MVDGVSFDHYGWVLIDYYRCDPARASSPVDRPFLGLFLSPGPVRSFALHVTYDALKLAVFLDDDQSSTNRETPPSLRPRLLCPFGFRAGSRHSTLPLVYDVLAACPALPRRASFARLPFLRTALQRSGIIRRPFPTGHDCRRESFPFQSWHFPGGRPDALAGRRAREAAVLWRWLPPVRRR